jgi:SAM-dependent methyltransferase
MEPTIDPNYFVELYRRESDPWNFEGSEYEARKYRATIDALARARYSSALELACSIGVFTAMLAERCDRLLACDVSPDALRQARRRCAALRHVRFEQIRLPDQFPRGRFDLITFCEAAFYFCAPDLARIRDAIADALARGGHLVLVHWTPPVRGHALSTQAVHESFLEDLRFGALHGFEAETYRLDLLERQ